MRNVGINEKQFIASRRSILTRNMFTQMDTKKKLDWTMDKMLAAADHRKNHEAMLKSQSLLMGG